MSSNSKTNKKATMADVAQIANVSVSTVSHVINNTRFVSDEIRSKVLEAVKQCSYTQNYVAKALKQAKTYTIGLVISDIKNPYFIDIVSAIDEEMWDNGYQVFVASSRDNSKRELEIIQGLYERQIDGLIFSPSSNSAEYVVSFLKTIDLPVVTIDRLLDINCDWVGSENEESTQQLVEHLLLQGHKKIGFVSGARGINTTEERVNGYKKALKLYNIDYDERLIVCGDSISQSAEKAVLKLLTTEKDVSALVVANNLMVLGAMKALKTLHMEIGRDIDLVAFDDFDWADLFHPRLTTMAQPCAAIGMKAAQLLLRRIKDPSAEKEKILFAPRFMHRESCGCTNND